MCSILGDGGPRYQQCVERRADPDAVGQPVHLPGEIHRDGNKETQLVGTDKVAEQIGTVCDAGDKIIDYGLVEKYQMTNNRKNIILRPSEYGLSVYAKHASALLNSLFSDFFHQLEPCSIEDLDRFTQAIEALNNNVSDTMHSSGERQLVRID